jgi:hypothetical protein
MAVQYARPSSSVPVIRHVACPAHAPILISNIKKEEEKRLTSIYALEFQNSSMSFSITVVMVTTFKECEDRVRQGCISKQLSHA